MQKSKRAPSAIDYQLSAKLGFTLIELLVVISVIGILATLITVSFRGARVRARDGQRKSDLKTIRDALQMYYNDHGYYPPSCSCGHDCNGYCYSTSGGNWIPGLEAYMREIPLDPINNSSQPWVNEHYSYAYGNVGKSTYGHTYDLTTQLENKNDPDRCELKHWKFYFDDRDWCGSYSEYIYEASLD